MSMSNPANQAAQNDMYRRMAAVPADVRQAIGDAYGQTQITVLPLPYWSTIRFQAVLSGGPPATTATIDTTDRVAFGYAIGGAMDIAGFPAGFRQAGKADTNLKKAGETRNNEDVWVWGLACTILPTSEPALAARVWRETSLDVAVGADNTIPLGTLDMYPGAGGLNGEGRSFLKSPPTNVAGAGVDGGVGAPIGFMANGWPLASNFKRFPQPFKWSKVGGGGSDSSFNVIATPQTTIAENIGAAVVGPPAFTPPAGTGLGSFVEVRLQLISVSVRFRSVNQ